jgi:hypothetical protein
MKIKALQALTAVIVFLLAGQVFAEMTDPYEILNKNYEAIGGLDKIKAQKSGFVEGKIVIVGTGLEGTFKRWSQEPMRNRQEVDLKVIRQTSGDNGEYAWSVDHNGKMQVASDSVTIKERQVGFLMAEYDHLNRTSKNFKLECLGKDTAVGQSCYVVRMTNRITPDTVISYYDTQKVLLLKSTAIKLNGTSHTYYSDYRDADGILVSFCQDGVELPTGQKQEVTVTKVESNIPVDAALFEPPSGDVKDYSFANGKSVENLPFRYIENHIFLPITIKGKTMLWILDSGAESSVIDADFAAALGLVSEGNIKGQGAGQLVDVSFATLPPFDLEGLHFKEQKIISIKIKDIIWKSAGIEIAGILGFDFLSRLVTKIDYANEKISFYEPDSFQYNGNGKIIDAPISQDNMFHVPLTVEGKYSGLWNLDLGAGETSFHYPFAEANGFLKRPGLDNLGFGAGGSFKERRGRFAYLEFAGFKIFKPIISWSMEKGEGAFASGQLTGNLGNALFQHFVLYLDYKKGRVIVEKGDDFEKIFPENIAGLQFQYNDSNQITVVAVAPNSPAAQAGFQVGDVIESVNGIKIEFLDGIIAVRKLLREKPGTTYTFGVLRAGKQANLKMTLKDILG